MRTEHYRTGHGTEPVREVLDGLAGKEHAVVASKLLTLEREGTRALTYRPLPKWLERIKGTDLEVYELRPGQMRIIFYVDRRMGCFVLLHAFRKQQRRQPNDIEQGLGNLLDYLGRQGRL